MAKIVRVVVYNISGKIDHPYDYLCQTDEEVIGRRVVVPFGKANSPRKAMIIDAFTGEDENLKAIYMFLDEKPIVSRSQISLLHFLKSQYFLPYYRALSCLIPAGMDYKVERVYCHTGAEVPSEFSELISFVSAKKKGAALSDLPDSLRRQVSAAVSKGILAEQVTPSRNLGDLADKMLRLAVGNAEVEAYISSLSERSHAQIDVLQLLLQNDGISVKEALYMTGASSATIRTLNKNGMVVVYLQPRMRTPYENLKKCVDNTPIMLNDEQNRVFDDISSSLFGSYSVHLIHGITGSGKTHVYMKLIDKVVEQNKSVLFMVPEISLTPQNLSKFYARYGEKVAVIHSGLSMGQRMDEWKKIRSLPSSVVVGTRSAVFAPLNNLALVIMDEEHEASYKSESSPKFHTRDIAKYLCKNNGAALVLGSATPSLESYRAAQTGKYKLHSLTKRFNAMPLPAVEMVDMRQEMTEGNASAFSTSLKEHLTDVLYHKQQAILFLNRRGSHTGVICRKCGYTLKCPNCSIAMTYHSANNRCMCHFCSYSIKMFDKCPECGSEHIKMTGMGTQLAEQKLAELFPDARILRMDMDTVNNYISYQQMLSDFEAGKYDILLGTQMVAKGLNFPKVTLVGVLQADMSLYIDDFRAGERTFSLLTQVCGRSGRAEQNGKAIIQSYSPEHEVLRFAKSQDYISFYDYEIKFRKAINYPPFCDIALFNISSSLKDVAAKAANALFAAMAEHAKTDAADIPLRLLRPNTPRIEKVNQKYRMQLIVKCRNSVKFRNLAQQCMDEISQTYHVTVGVDINPLSFQ